MDRRLKSGLYLMVTCILSILLVTVEVLAMDTIALSSSVFSQSGPIPAKYTCDGEDVNPPLTIKGVPSDARSLALIVDDPDAPAGTWVHWVVWNIDAGIKEIGENSVPRGAQQGVNDFRTRTYGGPCPPSGTHRYLFKLYALNAAIALNAGATKAALEQAMKGHIIGRTELVGKYRRK